MEEQVGKNRCDKQRSMIAGTYVCHMADKITRLLSSIGELFAFFYKLQSYGEY